MTQLKNSEYLTRFASFGRFIKEKNAAYPFLIEDFPCRLHYGKRVYTDEALNMRRELAERVSGWLENRPR